MNSKLILVVLIALLTPMSVFSESLRMTHPDGTAFQVKAITTGLGVPWATAFIGHDKLLITERRGTLSILDIQTGVVKPIAGLPEIMAVGQGGLMDVVPAPDFPASRRLYFTYTKPQDGRGVTALASALFDEAQQALSNWQDLLITVSASYESLDLG